MPAGILLDGEGVIAQVLLRKTHGTSVPEGLSSIGRRHDGQCIAATAPEVGSCVPPVGPEGLEGS